MNNELKEILNDLSYSQHTHHKITLQPKELDLLVDYITNLQEGNEKLKETISKIPRYKMEYELEIDKLKNELEELEKNHDFRVDQVHNLQKRIDKAIEYIKSNEFIGRIRLSSENKEAINKLLEILGSDKEC